MVGVVSLQRALGGQDLARHPGFLRLPHVRVSIIAAVVALLLDRLVAMPANQPGPHFADLATLRVRENDLRSNSIADGVRPVRTIERDRDVDALAAEHAENHVVPLSVESAQHPRRWSSTQSQPGLARTRNRADGARR